MGMTILVYAALGQLAGGVSAGSVDTPPERPIALKEESISTSPNVNTVTLVGQLTADPVLRSLPDGRSVCDLRLAVNDQRDQPPLFIDVATFGPGADACAEYLTRGRAVGVTGRLVYQEWEKGGVKRSKHQIVGRVTFGGRDTADDKVAGDDQDSDH
jgi:single stranded DNA-binding protein